MSSGHWFVLGDTGVAASVPLWCPSFCSGMEQLVTPFQGMGQHRLETSVQGCYRTRQLGDTVTGMTRGSWAASTGTGGAEGGVSVPTCGSGAARSCLPGRACQEFGSAGGAGCLRAL